MGYLYDKIGSNYDTTRKADPEITRRLRYHLQVPDQSDILDIACGTGNYTTALEKTDLRMTGSDISSKMIDEAKEKSLSIRWELADVTQLPYKDGQFQGVLCTLAIHHFDDLYAAFEEAYRVLGQGRFVIFTSAPEQMERYWLNEYFPKAIDASAKQMPSLSSVADALEKPGFHIIDHERFFIQPDLQDFFLYSGKYKPETYLDENVRAGISTFTNLASKKEIEAGCRKLKQDIESNKIDETIAKYHSDAGDYTYVVAEKK